MLMRRIVGLLPGIACCLATAGLLSTTPAAQAAAAADYAWQRAEGSITLLKGGQEIWKFRYGKQEAKPAFHPLALPGGPVMTCYRNEDHSWHRGMWFSWKFINGVNYWEEDANGVSEGRTAIRNVKVDARPAFDARISLDLAYGPPDAQPVLTEKRVIDVSAPDAEGLYHIDWTMTFQALDKDVFLDRTPIPGEPNGKGYGGYAGLAVRFAREMEEIEVSTSEGPIVLTTSGYRGKAIAADYSGSIENSIVGIAFLDHPKNLNSPSPWWIINNRKNMKYFNPSVLGSGPHTLKARQTMTLRYRAIVHPGRWDAGRLRAESDRYLSGGN